MSKFETPEKSTSLLEFKGCTRRQLSACKKNCRQSCSFLGPRYTWNVFLFLYVSIFGAPFTFFRYFQYGKKDFIYGGGRNTDAFIKFMENPTPINSKDPNGEPEWKDVPSGVVHLTDDDFEQVVTSHSSVMVMFYAPCE